MLQDNLRTHKFTQFHNILTFTTFLCDVLSDVIQHMKLSRIAEVNTG